MECEWSDEELYARVLDMPGAQDDELLLSVKTVTTPTRNNTEDSCNTGIAENLDVDDNLTTATAGVTETSMEETGAALDKPAPGETKQSSSIQETEPKDAMPCTNSSDNNNDVDDDDDDIPLAIIQRAIRRNQHTRTPTDSPLSSEHDDSGNDSDYVPSDVTDSSTEKVAPISFDRRKRKWVRRRNRPLKREQNRKDIMNKIYPESIGVMKHKVRKILTSTKTKINRGKQKKKTVSTLKQSRTSLKRQLANKTDDNLERAIKLSRLEHNVHVKVKGYHERRLSNLLISNGLDRISVNPDGNCFFNAIICQLDTTDSAADFRQKICEHLLQNEEHYKVYLSTLSTSDTNEEKISSTYKQKVDAINSDGSWNVEMSDILPLATANVYKRNITIYTSRLNNPVIHVLQDLETKQEIDQSEDLKLAYLALQGYEHYDACVPKALLPSRTNTSPSDNASEQSHITQPKTPSKQANEPQGSAITPRKDAAYISPKKVKRTRKRTANIQLWKKNVRKARKNTGKSYVSATTKRIIDAKCVQPHNCNKCKYKCSQKVSEATRQKIFDLYYSKGMTYERKRDFICQHVVVKPTSKRYGRSYKQYTRTYSLPLDNTQVRVCKDFFLKTLDIGDKLIRYTLSKKQHGTSGGSDQRGKHTPHNKTTEENISYVKQHIASFPVVESHYQRKGTKRMFLEQGLSISKMFELYKTKCLEDDMSPVSEMVYRKIFCTEYNLSFHKPKKDICSTCNTFEQKKKANTITQEDKINIEAHIKRKEESRTEKENDKKVSQSDKSVCAVTFDLEAVLSTPCSNVSQVYYKRKLNSYNLTVYSLANKQGTCYIWDETHGQRGSSEIGTCVITYINSLPPVVRHVILYSDCCSGQNRNQYLASGLLHTVVQHPHVHTIEQKFLESGHTQMECDSMHSSIEHAKKRTSIFVPDQWDTVIHMARRNKPYVVIPLRFNNFFDLKMHTQNNYKNFKTDVEGNKVNWLKVKVLKVSKEMPDEIHVKYEYHEKEFKRLKVAKSVRGRPTQDKNLPRKYKSKLPISLAKKRDLLDLCDSLVIPEIYHGFYNSLLTSKTVKDCLPFPDALEEDIETDED